MITLDIIDIYPLIFCNYFNLLTFHNFLSPFTIYNSFNSITLYKYLNYLSLFRYLYLFWLLYYCLAVPMIFFVFVWYFKCFCYTSSYCSYAIFFYKLFIGFVWFLAWCNLVLSLFRGFTCFYVVFVVLWFYLPTLVSYLYIYFLCFIDIIVFLWIDKGLI